MIAGIEKAAAVLKQAGETAVPAVGKPVALTEDRIKAMDAQDRPAAQSVPVPKTPAVQFNKLTDTGPAGAQPAAARAPRASASLLTRSVAPPPAGSTGAILAQTAKR